MINKRPTKKEALLAIESVIAYHCSVAFCYKKGETSGAIIGEDSAWEPDTSPIFLLYHLCQRIDNGCLKY